MPSMNVFGSGTDPLKPGLRLLWRRFQWVSPRSEDIHGRHAGQQLARAPVQPAAPLSPATCCLKTSTARAIEGILASLNCDLHGSNVRGHNHIQTRTKMAGSHAPDKQTRVHVMLSSESCGLKFETTS